MNNMWFLYILKCSDNTYYTGITTDIERRLKQHNGYLVGGAKYTKIRNPVKIVYKTNFNNRSEASKEEYRIKKLKKSEKEKIIKKEII